MALMLSTFAEGFNWSRVRPNLRLVENFNGRRCGILWDGFRFPIKSTNGTLAGQELEGFTFPFVFGYNDYFILDATVETSEKDWWGAPVRKAVNLWCGEIFSAASYGFADSGAQGIFRQTPNSVLTFTSLLFSRRLLGMLMATSSTMFEIVPHFRRGGFFIEVDSGHMITSKMYFRREFAFLNSFTRETWEGIWISLLGLSLFTSMAGGSSGGRPTAIGLGGALVRKLVSWLRVALEFAGLMVGESSTEVHRYNRLLVGLWLAAATILSGCLSSSLLDLLAKAGVACWPEVWEDLLVDPFRNLTLVTSKVLPSWEDFPRVLSASAVQDLRTSGRLQLIGLIEDWAKYILEPTDILNEVLSILSRLDLFVILAFKRILMSVLWGITVCESALAEGLAFVFNDLQSNYTQHHLDQSYEKIYSIRKNFYEHGVISAGRGSMHWYFGYSALAAPHVTRWFDRYLVRLRDAGIMFIADELTDRKLEEKFMLNISVKKSCETLKVIDLIGPFIIYGILLLLTAGLAGFEKIFRRKKIKAVVAPVVSGTKSLKKKSQRKSLPRLVLIKSPRKKRSANKPHKNDHEPVVITVRSVLSDCNTLTSPPPGLGPGLKRNSLIDIETVSHYRRLRSDYFKRIKI